MLTRMVSISWPRDPPALASQSAGITGLSHHARLEFVNFKGTLCIHTHTYIHTIFILYFSLEGSHCAQPTLTQWAVMLHLCKGRTSAWIIYNSSAQEMCVFFPFYNLFISVWTHGCLFYTLGSNPVLCCLLFCPCCFSSGHWQLLEEY